MAGWTWITSRLFITVCVTCGAEPSRNKQGNGWTERHLWCSSNLVYLQWIHNNNYTITTFPSPFIKNTDVYSCESCNIFLLVRCLCERTRTGLTVIGGTPGGISIETWFTLITPVTCCVILAILKKIKKGEWSIFETGSGIICYTAMLGLCSQKKGNLHAMLIWEHWCCEI